MLNFEINNSNRNLAWNICLLTNTDERRKLHRNGNFVKNNCIHFLCITHSKNKFTVSIFIETFSTRKIVCSLKYVNKITIFGSFLHDIFCIENLFCFSQNDSLQRPFSFIQKYDNGNVQWYKKISPHVRIQA